MFVIKLLSFCNEVVNFSGCMSAQVASDRPSILLQHLYLGVIIDHKLSWQPHVDYVCGKAMKLIGFLIQNLHTCPMTFKNLS